MPICRINNNAAIGGRCVRTAEASVHEKRGPCRPGSHPTLTRQRVGIQRRGLIASETGEVESFRYVALRATTETRGWATRLKRKPDI